MQEDRFTQDFFQFLQASPTPFHAVSFMAAKLRESGFHELCETRPCELLAGNSYFIIRDNGALAAFTLASSNVADPSFRIMGTHTDSPALQIKPLAGKASHSFFQLGVEVYGGPLLSTWFDRELSIAGRVVCRTSEGALTTLLIDFKRPVAIIPSLAIHFDREANKGHAINKQKELVPILSQITEDDSLNISSILAEQIQKEHSNRKVEAIISFDLFCYDCQPPSFLGLGNEFISASRLDNLLSCFVGYSAMIEALKDTQADNNRLLICNNHEEIGSLTAAGAKGSFLHSILGRIMPDPVTRDRTLHGSFFISMDNAHGVHPNFSDKSDPDHTPLLNHGPVIKSNANQSYATTSISGAIYKTIATEAGVTTQDFVMRSDMACGSTIGPQTSALLGIPTVDIGAPTLAMHSIREMTGSHDPFLLYRTINRFLTRKRLPQTEG
ncbi:MAG: M18 family aminopeptidase [Desulfocapsaceae bacterium]|nr:M18 family aminopeptidase [Desulfocapsaceae bacterium]